MTAVSNEMILQAITELSKITVTLSNDMVGVKADIVEMKEDIVGMKADIVEIKQDIIDIKVEMVEMNENIDRNQKKTERLHNVYMVQSEDIMDVRADMMELKSAL